MTVTHTEMTNVSYFLLIYSLIFAYLESSHIIDSKYKVESFKPAYKHMGYNPKYRGLSKMPNKDYKSVLYHKISSPPTTQPLKNDRAFKVESSKSLNKINDNRLSLGGGNGNNEQEQAKNNTQIKQKCKGFGRLSFT